MKKLLMVFMLCLVFCAPVFAKDPLKIAVIDMNQILQKSPIMISINNELMKKFKPRQDALNEAKKKLQEDTDQLALKSQTMSSEARTKFQNQIINDKANVSILQASLEKDLAIAKNADLQTFMTKFTSVIKEIAKEGKYDIIEQRTTIIYLNEDLDITQKVLQQLT